MFFKCYLVILGKERMYRGLLFGEFESDFVVLIWKVVVCRILFIGRFLIVCKGHIDLFGGILCYVLVKDIMFYC